MNERIRELELAAYIEVTSWVKDPASGYQIQTTVKEFNREKFAELIVGECFYCVDIMEKIAHSTNASIPKDYDKHTYLKTLDTMRGLLKTHFGVK